MPNVLCERGEYEALTDFLEELSVLLQDSDDEEEKEKIQNGLKKMADTTSYVALGEEGAGKTSLLRMLFQGIIDIKDDMIGDICEYRWGGQDFDMPVREGIQRRFISSSYMQGLSIIDTKGIDCMGKAALEKVKEISGRCSAIFVVFSIGNIRAAKMWDMIEAMPEKKMIFFVTKCDMVSPEALHTDLKKLKSYMQEANISAPVFPVSVKENGMHPDMADSETVRLYIRQKLIGENPMLRKQRENIEEITSMLVQLHGSLVQRERQYDSDAKILQKINASMDSYMLNHRDVIAVFTQKLAEEINRDIDQYEQEIISKLEPVKIKERFKDKKDFTDYLNLVNDNYKTMMNESVNRKTIQVMKDCLNDLEIVFQEAVGYFNERENILALNDRFYGSMIHSRNQIAAGTKEAAVMAGEFYQTLTGASEEFFLQIWKGRKKYDESIARRKTLSWAAGGSAGIGAGVAGAGSLASFVSGGITAAGGSGAVAGAAVFAGGTAGIFAVTGLIGIGIIVGAAAGNALAKKLFDPKAAREMEKNTLECIQQFQEEVSRIRKVMVKQVTDQVIDLFDRELALVDGCFTDFRISVNVEGENLPLLQRKLEKIERLEEHIRNMEGSGRKDGL